MSKKAEKIKLLLYGDSPVATTGLGKLHRILLKELNKSGKYDITVVGINHNVAWYDHEEFPYRIMSAAQSNDPAWGSTLMTSLLKSEKFDLVIFSHDFHRIIPFYSAMLEVARLKGTKWIVYTPVDKMTVGTLEAKLMEVPDKVLTYSDYAVEKIKEKQPKLNVERIYLPLDFEELRPSDPEQFKQQEMGFRPSSFVVTNVNRNIFRKNLGATIYAFNKFWHEHQQARLYLHCTNSDQGGKINEFILENEVQQDLVTISDHKTPAAGYVSETMNFIYNASDVIVSTAKGEGFGYSTVEAFATKKPFIGPRNTSFIELVGKNEERGYLVDCPMWAYDYGISLGKRELVDPDEFAEKLSYVYDHMDEAQAKADLAYEWVKENLDKKVIVKQWQEQIDRLLQS